MSHTIAFARAFAPDSITWTQLEPGTLHTGRAIVDLGPLRVSYRSFNLGLKGEGALLPGKSLVGIIGDSLTRARWSGAEVTSDHVASTTQGLDIRTEGPSSFYFLTFDADELQYRNVLEGLVQNPLRAQRLRAHLRVLFSTFKTRHGLTRARQSQVARLLLALASTDDAHDTNHHQKPRALSRRITAVRTCERYMREHINETVTLSHLTEVSGLRARSLINAFEALTGLSPIAYLKRRRLTGVHRALQKADSTNTRIIDVATNWGFWHMGHFTSDYRAMFGETPSETLRRRDPKHAT